MAVFIYVPSTSDIEREDMFKKKGLESGPSKLEKLGKETSSKSNQKSNNKEKKGVVIK